LKLACALAGARSARRTVTKMKSARRIDVFESSRTRERG